MTSATFAACALTLALGFVLGRFLGRLAAECVRDEALALVRLLAERGGYVETEEAFRRASVHPSRSAEVLQALACSGAIVSCPWTRGGPARGRTQIRLRRPRDARRERQRMVSLPDRELP